MTNLTTTVNAIRARKPTGAVPYPLILVEGQEKSGKSWAAVRLSASERVGQTYWLDIAEGSADEYGSVPGARHLVIEHDGSWAQILGQVTAVRAEAQRAKDAHEPPVVLVIDTLTAVWEGLKDWASEQALQRAARKNNGRAVDPENVRITMDLWNAVSARHQRLMDLLLTFPGLVVVIARGKQVAHMDDKGQPVAGQKDYRVEAHKNLAFDATVWVRMQRDSLPLVVGARSVHSGIKPGVDEPKPIPADVDNILEWLVFDALKVDPLASHVRDIKGVTGGEQTPAERGEDPVAVLRVEVREAAAQVQIAGSAIRGDYAARYGDEDINEADEDGLRTYLADLRAERASA